MDSMVAEAVLDLWTTLTLGWMETTDDNRIMLVTPEEDYYYDNICDAAEDCIPTIREWIERNF